MTPSIFKRYSLAFKKHVVAEYEAVEVFQGLGREADPAILASADDQRDRDQDRGEITEPGASGARGGGGCAGFSHG